MRNDNANTGNRINMPTAQTRKWFHALASTVITGSCSAGMSALGITGAHAIGINVQQLNLKQFLGVMAGGGLVGMLSYFQKSPLPPEDGDAGTNSTEQKTETNNIEPKTNMKIAAPLIAILSAIGILCFASQGCKTVSQPEVSNGVTNQVTKHVFDPDTASKALHLAATVGVPMAVKADTNSAAYLRAAAVLIKAEAESGNYDPDQLHAALSTISIKELRTGDAPRFIEAALGLYSLTVGAAMSEQNAKVEWLTPVLEGLANGILDALPPVN
jgi:hypothetical protein